MPLNYEHWTLTVILFYKTQMVGESLKVGGWINGDQMYQVVKYLNFTSLTLQQKHFFCELESS